MVETRRTAEARRTVEVRCMVGTRRMAEARRTVEARCMAETRRTVEAAHLAGPKFEKRGSCDEETFN